MAVLSAAQQKTEGQAGQHLLASPSMHQKLSTAARPLLLLLLLPLLSR
jgi:hypothetical protein